MLSWLCAGALILGMLSALPVSAEPGDIRMLGDIDGDGRFSSTDARLLLLHLSGERTLSDGDVMYSDVDGDKNVDTDDVRRILLMCVNAEQGNTPVLTDIDLIAPDADLWHDPVLLADGARGVLTQEKISDGAMVFENHGGVWPCAWTVYPSSYLLPLDSRIEYDISVRGGDASIDFYVGAYTEDLTVSGEGKNSSVKLNSYIASGDQLNSDSQDLHTGDYSGSVLVSELFESISDEDRQDDMVMLSGIMVYVPGGNGSKVTINRLAAQGFVCEKTLPMDESANGCVRPSLVLENETEGLPALTGMRVYQNGIISPETTVYSSRADIRKHYQTEMIQRVVNYTDGYCIDLPYDWQEDYSLGALRSRFTSKDAVLNLTYETQNPYNGPDGWDIYFHEWLTMYVADNVYSDGNFQGTNMQFFMRNNLSYQRSPSTSDSVVPGYEVSLFDIVINDNAEVAMPYYSIAVIRKPITDWSERQTFYLMVLKSPAATTGAIDRLLRSFRPMTPSGAQAVNAQQQYEPKIPQNWSEETRNYYNKLTSQTTLDFGIFSHSMTSRNDGAYYSAQDNIRSDYDTLSRAIGCDYAIMPTYTHIGSGFSRTEFPLEMAQEFAGGNGFNGKPVLQFTYQFTTENNLTRYSGTTPMFDILRGQYDSQFRALAQGIKSYGRPVLFRLNNEMNTDWTSYCGMTTLIDPDIFVLTWQRLYTIFEEEGVDNCIWIFNPVAKTTPYCRWGEDLCYMPGTDYVQILGLTSYESGNTSGMASFKSLYTDLYEKNKDHFQKYPWVISEFACGAGGDASGELGHNASLQAQWVQDMFTCFANSRKSGYEFCRNIKGAVWFSANDYSGDRVTNFFELDPSICRQTLQNIKTGLANVQRTVR